MLPEDYITNPPKSVLPRGKGRIDLARMGLVGKIRLDSSTDETNIREEICSVFSEQMQYDTQVPVKIFMPWVEGPRHFQCLIHQPHSPGLPKKWPFLV